MTAATLVAYSAARDRQDMLTRRIKRLQYSMMARRRQGKPPPAYLRAGPPQICKMMYARDTRAGEEACA